MRRVARGVSGAVFAGTLTACATTSLNEAPIVDRSVRTAHGAATPASVAPPVPASAPVLQNAPEARSGTYVVQRGDTLFSIAMAFGQDFRDIARWNGLQDPSRISVGQTLRVAPPVSEAGVIPESGAVVVAPVAPPAAVEVRPLDRPAHAAAGTPPAASAPEAAARAPAAPAVAASAPPTAATGAGGAGPGPAVVEPAGAWVWPARGPVIASFDEARNKGIGIAGTEGDPVVAANDGQVVYVGSGLRGYGNLLIVKHSDDFVSAYAHNRQILVKQGDQVKRGQRVAELGRSDAERPKLHFEIRRRGKPVDPLQYLPPPP